MRIRRLAALALAGLVLGGLAACHRPPGHIDRGLKATPIVVDGVMSELDPTQTWPDPNPAHPRESGDPGVFRC